jgi:NAD-dependent dihydropyrimidine dehydrogenase PreA subunit
MFVRVQLCRDRQAPLLVIECGGEIDWNRCEGKGPCVEVCRDQVLAMGVLGRTECAALTWVGWIKAYARGNRQVFVVRPSACAAGGDCIQVCPEQAIKLTRLIIDSSAPFDPARSSS